MLTWIMFFLDLQLKLNDTKILWIKNHKYDDQCTKEVKNNTPIVQYFTFTRYKHEKPEYVPLGPATKVALYKNFMNAKP